MIRVLLALFGSCCVFDKGVEAVRFRQSSEDLPPEVWLPSLSDDERLVEEHARSRGVEEFRIPLNTAAWHSQYSPHLNAAHCNQPAICSCYTWSPWRLLTEAVPSDVGLPPPRRTKHVARAPCALCTACSFSLCRFPLRFPLHCAAQHHLHIQRCGWARWPARPPATLCGAGYETCKRTRSPLLPQATVLPAPRSLLQSR